MKYRHLIFDFDGVLVESNAIRFDGFRKLFSEYPAEPVECLVDYARANGGISRYVKIRYFFENLLGRDISESEVNRLAAEYSRLVKQCVVEAVAVSGSVEFLEKHGDDFDFALVSGSDQEELLSVCEQRNLAQFFKRILGSPTEKHKNIAAVLEEFMWDPAQVVYIGDSNNDRDAALANGIDFIGRCSGLVDWAATDETYISNLHELANALD